MAYKLESAGPIALQEHERITEIKKQREQHSRAAEKQRQQTRKRYADLRKKFNIPSFNDDPAVQAAEAAITGSEKALTELRGELANCNSELNKISAEGGAKGMISRVVELESRKFGIQKGIASAETGLRKLQDDYELAVNAAKTAEGRRWQKVSDQLTAEQQKPLELFLELEKRKRDVRGVSAFAGWMVDRSLNPAAALESIRNYLKSRN